MVRITSFVLHFTSVSVSNYTAADTTTNCSRIYTGNAVCLSLIHISSCAAESGYAGQTAIETSSVLSQNEFVGASAQKDVLLEVKAGTVELGVLDYVMAKASIGEGTDYSDLMIVEGVELAPEAVSYTHLDVYKRQG